ncbi:MAG: helix-turn-helix transcriptional regulator [Alphaproteobacteria bacterium]
MTDGDGKPRRSAGMRGHPLNAAPEHRDISSTVPDKPRPEPEAPVRASSSRFASPKVLMGEVTMPRGQEIAQQREGFRAFMLARRLSPTVWARNAGIPAAQILGFLAGTTRTLPQTSLEKLARAAKCAVQDFFAS